ncbi:MAG: hypothetical protein ABL957_14365, partial [Parvularculaceae bacterium]
MVPTAEDVREPQNRRVEVLVLFDWSSRPSPDRPPPWQSGADKRHPRAMTPKEKLREDFKRALVQTTRALSAQQN